MEYKIGDENLEVKIDNLEVTSTLRNSANIGAVPSAVSSYISAVEYGDDCNHVTVLTLDSLPILIDSSATNAVSCGAVGLYEFPECVMLAGNSFASIALSVPATMSQYIADTDADGDFSVGTAATIDGDLSDAGEANLIASTAIAIADQYAASATVGVLADASKTLIDGSSAAKTAYLNMLFDAGEVTVVTDMQLLVSGTIVLEWKYLS
jgi:hypothetical protein